MVYPLRSMPGHAPDAVKPDAPMDHTGHGVSPEEHAGHAPDAVEPDAPMDHTAHTEHADHRGDAGGHGTHMDHTGHELMFRNRFWVSLVLTVPVLLYSSTVQGWLELHNADIQRQLVGHTRFRSGHIPLRWRAVLTNVAGGAPPATTMHDDADLAGHWRSVCIQPAGLLPRSRRRVLLRGRNPH